MTIDYHCGNDLFNTSLHVSGDDLGLTGGLSPNVEKDAYTNTGHPCRLILTDLANQIGLVESRVKRILDKYMNLLEQTETLCIYSYLNEKMKRNISM